MRARVQLKSSQLMAVAGESELCCRRRRSGIEQQLPRMMMLIQLMAFFLIAGVKAEIYLARFAGTPVVYYDGSIEGFAATGVAQNGPRIDATSAHVQNYVRYLERSQDRVLADVFHGEMYTKVYSYSFLVNGVALDITDEQAEKLRSRPEVLQLSKDGMVKTVTTHTPDYLGLPSGIWKGDGGSEHAGEGVIVGVLDTGIDPTHPSFADTPANSYSPITSFRGSCEIADTFPSGSCNNKLVGARHFADAAIAAGVFNASYHFASPLDGDGHGTHTASTAAGNHGVAVNVKGFNFGMASGMAPRARLSIYKCLYRDFGGYFADVVAGIEQAGKDNIDVLSLSIGPGGPPPGVVYLNIFDVALLGAVHAGVVVVQAAGNSGPYQHSTLSFGPWIISVAASTHDRTYPNNITLKNNQIISGLGFARGTKGISYALVSAEDAQNKTEDPSTDCQNQGSLLQQMVSGRILICEYNSNFFYGEATLSQSFNVAKALGAAGVVFALTIDFAGVTLTPSPLDGTLPGVIISTYEQTQIFNTYYKQYTNRSSGGVAIQFGATAVIAGGTTAAYSGVSPVVAAYSSRGPAYNDAYYDLADILKPNILAPGSDIWAAWSTIGIDSTEFSGERFATISGTSMATPHISGIAALLKQKNPTWSPAAVASALATTADVSGKGGKPLMAEHPSTGVNTETGVAVSFDYGSGFVNPEKSVDPGLVFDAGIQDYAQFLCKIPTVTSDQVKNATGLTCANNQGGYASDLNAPSIVVANLVGSRFVPRIVTNVADVTETYKVRTSTPKTFIVAVNPSSFTVAPSKTFKFVSNITSVAKAPRTSSFGFIYLDGNKGHSVRIAVNLVY